jgi:hypothetical protein
VVDTPGNLPSFVKSPSFPLEGQLRVKRVEPAVESEPPREGEDPSSCVACSAHDDAYVWVSERWRVRATEGPTGLPMVLILESRSHLDLGDLPNLLAAELGVMTVRLERAIRSLEEVAQVHVNRWGDGAAHLHVWFLGRPAGRLQLRGPFLAMWDEILDPVPEAQWRINLAHIAAWLEEFGGHAQIEPPRIEWHAPSTFESLFAAETPSETPAAVEPARDGSASADPVITGAEIEPAAADGESPSEDADAGEADASQGGASDHTSVGAAEEASASARSDETAASESNGAATEGASTADASPARAADESADKSTADGATTVRIPTQQTRRGTRVGPGPRSVAASTRDHVVDHAGTKVADDGADLDLAAEPH